MTDLVVISLEAWDDVWRRNQHLVAGLLRRGDVGKVLFVEPPLDHLHEIAKGHRPEAEKAGLRTIDLPGVSEGQLMALRQWKMLPRRIDPSGDRRRARHVARVASSLAISEPVLWINDPGGHAVLQETGWPSLYDITDDWLAAERPSRELIRIEAQERDLLRHCDAVVVCSPKLLEKGLTENPARLVPNAVDVAAYRQQWERPEPLPAGRVALYVGTLHRDRLDLQLTVDTARRLSGTANVVLLGPIALEPADRELLERAGVKLLGPVPSATVPAYLQHADVLILPHVLSPFTESLDPIKAYEYKAAGRPVVSTAVPGFREDTTGQVHVVEMSEFAEQVHRLLAADLATTHFPDVPDWGVRVSAFEEILKVVSR